MSKEPRSVEVAGRTLACLVCGEGRFTERKALLNTAILSFFDLDWANRSARCYVCERCGHVHWFLPRR